MTTVVEHPAQSLIMEFEMTFDEFAGFVWRKHKRDLQHKNGKRIELDPNLAYVMPIIGMKRLLTKKEFALVWKRIEAEIKKMELEGILEEDFVPIFATPFDVPNRPPIPAKFADELENGVEIVTYLTGELSFTVAKKYPQSEVPEFEGEENEEVDE